MARARSAQCGSSIITSCASAINTIALVRPSRKRDRPSGNGGSGGASGSSSGIKRATSSHQACSSDSRISGRAVMALRIVCANGASGVARVSSWPCTINPLTVDSRASRVLPMPASPVKTKLAALRSSCAQTCSRSINGGAAGEPCLVVTVAMRDTGTDAFGQRHSL